MLRRIIVSVAAAVAPAALSAGVAPAVPCSPVTCASLSIAPAGSSVLLLRPLGLRGSLQAFDLRTGKTAASLPGGVLSADGRRFVAAAVAPGGARVARYDAATGVRLGTWRVPGAGARLGAVSANGRYAALVRGNESPRISVVDLVRRVVLRTVRLSGPWQVDALSADATRLYLLNYLRDGYRVRVDIAGRGLSPRAITDPSDPEPMNGLPWSTVGTRDGRQQLTLFVKSTGQETRAFIHALSLDRSTAACIDLPSVDLMANGRYALVLSPDGRTLYAANPSLGVVAEIDLARHKVVSITRFQPAGADERESGAFGAVAPDGRTVYFSAGRDLLAYDTGSRTVRAPYRLGAVIGVGVAPGGKTLLVVRPDQTAVSVSARTGAPSSA